MVFDYLRERQIPIDARLATAFFFALRTETRDLGREATEAERRAYLELVPVVDHNLLYRMTHPKVPREHFAALDRALRSAQVHGDIVAVNLGTLGYPDLVAEIADLLLSYEGARFVLCMGQYDGSAYLSLRTEASEARAGIGDAPDRRHRRRGRRARHDGGRAAVHGRDLADGAAGGVRRDGEAALRGARARADATRAAARPQGSELKSHTGSRHLA